MRSPNQWAEVQRSFHHAYDADATPFERFDVHYRYRYTDVIQSSPHLHRTPATLAFAAIEVIEHLASLHPSLAGPGDRADVALWPIDAQPGDQALLWFETAPAGVHGLPRVGAAVLVGEPAPNGALCLEVDDRTIWPTYNPREPADWLHGWDHG
jgi:hypothetical protein